MSNSSDEEEEERRSSEAKAVESSRGCRYSVKEDVQSLDSRGAYAYTRAPTLNFRSFSQSTASSRLGFSIAFLLRHA